MYFICIWYVELQNELANIALEFYFFKSNSSVLQLFFLELFQRIPRNNRGHKLKSNFSLV